MPYYNVCPNCGACLDPSEECDCTERRKNQTVASKPTPKKPHTNSKKVSTIKTHYDYRQVRAR